MTVSYGVLCAVVSLDLKLQNFTATKRHVTVSCTGQKTNKEVISFCTNLTLESDTKFRFGFV